MADSYAGFPALRLGLEFLGFSGSDVHDGLAAIQEKRKPRFVTDD